MKRGLISFGTIETVGTSTLADAERCTVEIAGCLLMLCQSGTADISINFRKYELHKGRLAFVIYDTAMRIDSVSDDFSMLYVSLPVQYIDDISLKVISARFWDYTFVRPVHSMTQEQEEMIGEWARQMKWGIEKCNKPQRGIFIANAFQNFLIAFDNELQQNGAYLDNALNKDSKWTLTSKFCALVAKHSTVQHDVAFYADALAITPGYLYKLVRNNLGASPKAMIDMQLATEVKSLLLNTDLSVKVIAAQLHFQDTSYLCRFFHRLTGMSPKEFREGEC